ncbi:MAG: hypothetical protein BWK79_01740, partial [Beggiatoa sp. IS2]
MSTKYSSRKRAGVKSVSKKKLSKRMVALALASGVVLPASGWAATLQGVRFIDSSPFASNPLNESNELLYLVRSSIVFQPLNSPNLSEFSTSVMNGSYSIQLANGQYEVRQSVNSALLTPSQLATVQW